MSKPFIYYPEQCDYCLKRGGCDYEKKTRLFLATLCGFDRLTHGVYGSLNFACDYFDLDLRMFNWSIPVESCDTREVTNETD